MTEAQRQRLRGIKTFNQLLAFLREDLDWPIEDVDDEDDLTFDWSDDLGLKDDERVGIKAIKQLRPLESGQPWGIFFIDFEKKRLPIVILRRVLNALVMKKRAGANRAERAAWKQHDLLFISAYGKQDERELTFAHFSEPSGELADSKPTLRVLGWDDEDTNLKLDHVADVLHNNLTWPQDTSDLSAWRQRWADAFELRPHQVIDTAQELAMRLAELAKRIRNRAMLVLPRESESGPLRKLMKGFKTALIHDLTDESFADMYAQTITYGLFSAAVSRTVPGAGTAVVQDNVVDMIPVTNPFLKEMLQSFLKAGGRKNKLDFDELGIQEVVDLLNDPHTHLDAVLRDFGNKRRGEDPVIHFYEHFLSAYNKKLKVQRGVFYTPQPVVSYIVRSVHELLQTEFGLEDGLADTTTWGEMLKKHPDMKLPPLTDEPGEKRTISSDEPFVQILDPATGTATFLVEVIDVIHHTLLAKWKQQRLSEAQQRAAWNSYVPQDLLPRLHAYELMMAPYAIAHMKIGLKLAETGYHFGSEERARIYLTNALEPWVKQLPLIGFDALAHEAAAVNEIKRFKRFTVIIGNPPYSEKSKNDGAWINGLMTLYKTTIRSEEAQIKSVSNDYIKFLCFIQHTVDIATKGTVGVITSNGYLDGRLFRDLRSAWIASFGRTDVLNLHGSGRRGDAAFQDENVFDILQGVGILIALKSYELRSHEVRYSEMLGPRNQKYDRLSRECVINGIPLSPHPPLFLFTPSTAAQTQVPTWPLSAIFGTGNPGKDRNKTYAGGFKTRQDSFTVAFDERTLRQRIAQLADNSISEAKLRKAYGLCSTAHFEFDKARIAAQSGALGRSIIRVRYRPFDDRPMIWSREVLCEPQSEVTRHLIRPNLCLATSRVIKDSAFRHVTVARGPVEVISLSTSTSTNAYMFPLYRYEAGQLFDGDEAKDGRSVNLSRKFIAEMIEATGLIWDESGTVNSLRPDFMTPEGVFSYLYALLHSPIYRAVFEDELLRDFPPIPLPGDRNLFRALAQLGSELTALHLLESPRLGMPLTKFVGSAKEVTRVGWTSDQGGTVWIDAVGTKHATTAGSSGFQGVPAAIWNFHIGGYQVCEKWLKDRKGRTLSPEDITHYQKIVVALSETIRLMAEIDKVIEQHGGWPGAFASEPERDSTPAPPQVVPMEAPKLKTGVTVRPSVAPATATDLFAAAPAASNDDELAVRPARVADVDDLGADELCAHIRQLFADGALRGRDAAIVELSRTLGCQRTGKNVRETIDNALRTSVRRGILSSKSDGLQLAYRTIEEYEADARQELKKQFVSSLAGTTWVKRGDAVVAFARWLGFRRAGPKIAEVAASLINGLLREDRLEAQGDEIRRAKGGAV